MESNEPLREINELKKAALPDSKGQGAPSIGDNCYIGAGARIIGYVKIGNNYRIGTGCGAQKEIGCISTTEI